jgi:hypothetical protein
MLSRIMIQKCGMPLKRLSRGSKWNEVVPLTILILLEHSDKDRPI